MGLMHAIKAGAVSVTRGISRAKAGLDCNSKSGSEIQTVHERRHGQKCNRTEAI